MNEPVIRTATVKDLPAIEWLLKGLTELLGTAQPYVPDRHALARYGFGEQRIYHTLLAEHGDSACGLCVYFPEFSTWRCQPGLYVQDLFVERQFRAKGLGRALLVAAMRQADAEWEAAYLRLAVHVFNRDALAFYKSLGFNVDSDNRVMLLTGPNFSKLMGSCLPQSRQDQRCAQAQN